MSLESNKQLIRRYYDELWNRDNLALADDILHPQIQFRGSLGMVVQGIDGYKGYVKIVRQAFPDFHNHVEEMVAEGDTVVARLTYTGTNKGELFGRAPSGKKVTYVGVAIFHVKDAKIVSGWVLGDRSGLQEQL